MGLDIFHMRFKLFLTGLFRSQPHILGDIGQHFCTFSNNIPNWPVVSPMRLIDL